MLLVLPFKAASATAGTTQPVPRDLPGAASTLRRLLHLRPFPPTARPGAHISAPPPAPLPPPPHHLSPLPAQLVALAHSLAGRIHDEADEAALACVHGYAARGQSASRAGGPDEGGSNRDRLIQLTMPDLQTTSKINIGPALPSSLALSLSPPMSPTQ